MMNQKQAAITEDDKQRLTEHLIGQVILGISGRDQEDLVDAVPSRTIFAGVLQPAREVEITAAQRGATGGDAPAGTALGLDFRVRPLANESVAHLRITPRWSHYYAVFPTWQQVLRATGMLPDKMDMPVQADVLPGRDGALSADKTSETQDDATLMEDIQISDEIEEEEQPAIPGLIVLPRVFRRQDVNPGTFMVDVSQGQPLIVQLGSEAIATAIQQAQFSMQNDPSCWRHLGSPEQRERVIGNAGVLATSETYAKALDAVKGDQVPLPSWSAALQVETGPDPAEPGALRIRILLVNATAEYDETVADPGLQERSLFDAGIVVEIEGGSLLPFDFLLAPKDYRNKPQMAAKGINCTALWNVNVPNRLETETLPIFRQPLYRTRDTLEIKFEALDTGNLVLKLEQLADQMDSYLQAWNIFLQLEAPGKFTPAEIEACKNDRSEFVKEIERYRLGIETLRRDAKLANAFRFMNRTFFRIGEASGGRISAWRMFQIGFIVSQLPSLAVRELSDSISDDYAQALRAAFSEVGVLWFPTGGGKTEAYLGLIAIALLYDRLRGKTRGICAWMRFPLRMLSLQQLERLARVIAVLNQIRAEEPKLSMGDPFAIGYYVGEGVTPNSLVDEDMRRYEQNKDLREEVRLLRKCPFCGSRIDIEPKRSTWRLAHVCSNTTCFSNTSDSLGPYKGSLPVCIVDNEIYRYLPSVLVGTVDKLAIVGRNRNFVHLVRGAKQQCPTHGYTSYDECLERWAGCKAGKRNLANLIPIKDPGPSLLIQDELHLLRAELGVFNGHYEGLLKYLGAKAFLPPKVLAATATIEAYDTHAFHLYLSRARRYPQPAWEQGESFYATSKPKRYRRYYVGVLCHSRAIEDPTLQILARYQKEIRRLKANRR
jgi:hypothetical protein